MNISLYTHHTIYCLFVVFVGRLVDGFLGRITTVGCQTALTRFHALLALCGRLMETRPSKTNSQIPDYVQNLLLERSALIFPFGNLWTFSPWHYFNLSLCLIQVVFASFDSLSFSVFPIIFFVYQPYQMYATSTVYIAYMCKCVNVTPQLLF